MLLVRTGRWEREREAGVWDFSQNASGLHASVARWLKERDVAAIGSDGTNDVFPSETLTKAVIDQWTTEISNWGRWGEDDQLGTLNLITPAKRRQAAALVSEGITVSLASDLSKEENVNNPYPLEHTLFTGEEGGAGYAMDTYTIRYHGLIHSHVDALCHIFHQGRLYNGYSQALAKPTGCEKTRRRPYEGRHLHPRRTGGPAALDS